MINCRPIYFKLIDITVWVTIAKGSPKDLSLEQAVKKVAAKYHVKYDDLISTKRDQELVQVRKICYQLLRSEGCTYKRIADLFNRDHSTIMHACDDEYLIKKRHYNKNRKVKINQKRINEKLKLIFESKPILK